MNNKADIKKNTKIKSTTLNVLFPLQTFHTNDSLLSTIDTWTKYSTHYYGASIKFMLQLCPSLGQHPVASQIPTNSQTCAVDISRSLFGVLFFPLNMQIMWKCNKQKFSSSLGSTHSLSLSHPQTCIFLNISTKIFNKTACVPVLLQANK